mgnify:CR=1 FL=1
MLPALVGRYSLTGINLAVASGIDTFLGITEIKVFSLKSDLTSWAISVLFEGKCRLKQTFVIASYAMIPQIINSILFIILSQFLTSDEAVILSVISVLSLIVSGIVIVIGNMIINEFNFFKFFVII